ncbi:TIGR01244 family sulfur transferase [Polymorphum gilvum]|uniref:Beta-lactamase hydrolase-like protein n=1 Tax=Polymorphum gilvum (strain LMG 25793 / CGMCC 1.9160 / SL003B-26A1) TaxID=991905 RepID=F2IVF9_POLGS|nr:TIGR01244 family sulfur transferase [Polymorphum gilvum]ADZ72677.1 Beta-lactamase hydrolase-like protein [Polymorphum gilvum SL003B-26A1]
MDIRKISSSLSVAPQIEVADLAAVAAQGFRTVVNNRPDGEAPGQPGSDAMEAAARALGLAYLYIPVVSGRITDEDIEAFRRALATVEGPVFAYCRSGTRSTCLWALAEAARGGDIAGIVSAAAEAGYALDGLRPRLEACARAATLSAEGA